MKYKVGDEVLVKGKVEVVDGVKFPVVLIAGLGEAAFPESELTIGNKTYEQGLADAWSLARRLYEMDKNERRNILGYVDYANLMEFVTPNEALAKIEAYEKREIKVNSVVRGAAGGLGVVTRADKDKAYVLWDDGSFGLIGLNKIEELEDTGKTVDVLDEIFGKIGE